MKNIIKSIKPYAIVVIVLAMLFAITAMSCSGTSEFAKLNRKDANGFYYSGKCAPSSELKVALADYKRLGYRTKLIKSNTNDYYTVWIKHM